MFLVGEDYEIENVIRNSIYIIGEYVKWYHRKNKKYRTAHTNTITTVVVNNEI